jgi:hypothetical protein
MSGFCLTDKIIYQASVVTTQPNPTTHTYIGLTANDFKSRLGNQKKSFNHYRYRNETTLSQFIWNLKGENIDYDIFWKIMDRAEPFNPVSGICNLCTLEKFYLIFKPETYTINKNDEINSYCLHKEAQLLEKT